MALKKTSQSSKKPSAGVRGTQAQAVSASTKTPKKSTPKVATSKKTSQLSEQHSVEDRLSIVEECLRNFRLSYKPTKKAKAIPLELVLDDILERLKKLESK